MLYVVKFANGWFKVGHTSNDIWTRACHFWTNQHPTELCGKLGPDDVEIVALFAGGREEEQALFAKFPPKRGEFYDEGLEALLSSIELPELPVPEKPGFLVQSDEKLPCCGGVEYTCFQCNAKFLRGIKLKQHLDDVHRKVRAKCAGCGLEVIKRNLKRHQSSCKK